MDDFIEKLGRIADEDKRYKLDAYDFVLEALSYIQKKTKKKGHISGQELLLGIREYALSQFGGLSKAVLEHWGVKSTEDFGEIVFNMVNENLLYKTEGDSKEDFKGFYNFEEAFKVKFDADPV